MNERRLPKLKLNKTTLRNLDREELDSVQGGTVEVQQATRGWTNCIYCGLTRISPKPCYTDHCSLFSDCCW